MNSLIQAHSEHQKPRDKRKRMRKSLKPPLNQTSPEKHRPILKRKENTQLHDLLFSKSPIRTPT